MTIAAVCGADGILPFLALIEIGWYLMRANAVLMIISGYMASVSVVTTVKWFWFLFGIGMFVPVIYSLARTFRETVIMRKDPEIMELYGKVAWLTIIIWCFYPIVWLFSEGFASFSVSFEVSTYH